MIAAGDFTAAWALRGGPVSDTCDYLALGRYLYWANMNRARVDALYAANEEPGTINHAEWLGATAYWYASVFVAIEGWRDNLKQSDAIIDFLLSYKDYHNLLRRCRNGVFHYQPDLLDSRFTDMFQPDSEDFLWVGTLHDEFTRTLRDRLDALPEEILQNEILPSMRSLIGFVPHDGDPTYQLTQTIGEAERKLASSKSEANSGTNDLIDLLKESRKVLDIGMTGLQQLRKDRLLKFGVHSSIILSNDGP
jgi:hypothetical protein